MFMSTTSLVCIRQIMQSQPVVHLHKTQTRQIHDPKVLSAVVAHALSLQS